MRVLVLGEGDRNSSPTRSNRTHTDKTLDTYAYGHLYKREPDGSTKHFGLPGYLRRTADSQRVEREQHLWSKGAETARKRS